MGVSAEVLLKAITHLNKKFNYSLALKTDGEKHKKKYEPHVLITMWKSI